MTLAKFSFFVTSLKAIQELSKSTNGFGGDLRFGVVGVTASASSMIVVTLLTPARSEEIQRMVDEVRVPHGDTIISSKA
mgnify:CR=1 FL=1